jgi:hypothetical protein
MRVLFINNSGAGFGDYVDVADGTDIKAFLSEKVSGYKPDDLLIRVNRQPVARDYVLQPNDRVSATPVKIDGARRRKQ